MKEEQEKKEKKKWRRKELRIKGESRIYEYDQALWTWETRRVML